EEQLPELHDAIDTAALEADRDPESITRLYNLMGLITAEDTGPFHGPVDGWARIDRVRVVEYRNLGKSGLKISVLTMGTMTFGGTGGFAQVGSTGVDE